MNLKYIFFALLHYLQFEINQCNSEKITYFSTERPVINWVDPRYFKNFTLTSRRLRRQDPRHYVEVYTHILIPLDNNMKPSFYFYQFLTNRYKPSFVEMHFRFCDMINTDMFFGQPLRHAFGDRRCPYPPFQPAYYDFKSFLFLPLPEPPTCAATTGASADAWFTYQSFEVYCKRWQPIGVKTLPKMQRYLPDYLDNSFCLFSPEQSSIAQGVYNLKNMSVPLVPKGFPFTKGRIYCNVSLTTGGVTNLIAYGSIDMEVKVANICTH